MTSRVRILVSGALLSLFLIQAPASAKPPRWVCGAGVVAVLAGSTVVGWQWLNHSPNGPVAAPIVGSTEIVPVEVERDEMEVRLEKFNAKFGADAKTYFGITKDDGEMPTLLLFSDTFMRRQIAEGVKKEIRAKKPEAWLPNSAGLTVRIERIGFLAEGPDHVRVLVGGGFFQLKSEAIFKRADIVAGTSFPVRFTPHVQPTKSGGKGTVNAFFRLAYNPELDRFEVTEGEGSFHVFTPGVFGVDDTDKGSIPAAHTARLGIAARP